MSSSINEPTIGDSPNTSAEPLSRTVMIAASVIGLLLVAFIVLLATADRAPGQIISSNIVDQVAPPIAGPTMQGGRFDLADHRGQWVVITVFATWCPGCIAEHPELIEFSERHEATGVAQVLSIAHGDANPQSVEEFFERNGGEWPVILDEDVVNDFATRYGVTTVPETYIVSPSGRVVAKVVGASGVTADQLDAALGLTVEP